MCGRERIKGTSTLTLLALQSWQCSFYLYRYLLGLNAYTQRKTATTTLNDSMETRNT